MRGGRPAGRTRMVPPRAAPERGTRARLHTIGARCGTLPRVMAMPTQPRRRRPRAATVRAIARRFESDLSASVLASGPRVPNVRQISERGAMGRALWRELVVGVASQLAALPLGFRPLPAPERARVAVGAAALATRAFSRKGRVVRGEPEGR